MRLNERESFRSNDRYFYHDYITIVRLILFYIPITYACLQLMIMTTDSRTYTGCVSSVGRLVSIRAHAVVAEGTMYNRPYARHRPSPSTHLSHNLRRNYQITVLLQIKTHCLPVKIVAVCDFLFE